eukprot:scaffold395_cov133-Isochrysis_galbana.AAC.10
MTADKGSKRVRVDDRADESSMQMVISDHDPSKPSAAGPAVEAPAESTNSASGLQARFLTAAHGSAL